MASSANGSPGSPDTPSASSEASTESWLTDGKWHLVTVTPWGRDAFCTQLDFALEQNQQTGILRFEKCVGEDFANYVLLQVADFALAQTCIRPVNHFQVIDRRPMKLADAKRMLGL